MSCNQDLLPQRMITEIIPYLAIQQEQVITSKTEYHMEQGITSKTEYHMEQDITSKTEYHITNVSIYHIWRKDTFLDSSSDYHL